MQVRGLYTVFKKIGMLSLNRKIDRFSMVKGLKEIWEIKMFDKIYQISHSQIWQGPRFFQNRALTQSREHFDWMFNLLWYSTTLLSPETSPQLCPFVARYKSLIFRKFLWFLHLAITSLLIACNFHYLFLSVNICIIIIDPVLFKHPISYIS